MAEYINIKLKKNKIELKIVQQMGFESPGAGVWQSSVEQKNFPTLNFAVM